jgi:rhamnosyl/mannosyltransferase
MNRHDSPGVLHVGKFYPPHMGGMETHLQALCGELNKSITVRVIAANDSRHHREDVIDGVRVTRLAQLFSVGSAQVCSGMARSISEARADIVHIHLPNPIALLAYLISGHQGRLVLSWHSDIVRQRILGRALVPIERRSLARAAACIATSPNYVESSPMLREHRSLCRVIPYGIPLEPFSHYDQTAVARIRERYGPRMILAVGRLIYYKGFEYLVRAMAHVGGRLVIVGDGPLREMLENEARTLGVRNRIFFAGEIQNHTLAPYYQAAEVFVLPSVARSEAFGIVQLEAMACGTPVVNTHIESGVPFVSLDGVTGITVPPRSPEQLAAAINRLLDDPHLRARYSAAALHRARGEFSVEKMTKRTLEVYYEVLSKGINGDFSNRYVRPGLVLGHERHS